jgi:hypothetical protein
MFSAISQHLKPKIFVAFQQYMLQLKYSNSEMLLKRTNKKRFNSSKQDETGQSKMAIHRNMS